MRYHACGDLLRVAQARQQRAVFAGRVLRACWHSSFRLCRSFLFCAAAHLGRRRLLKDLCAGSTQFSRVVVDEVLWICRHDIHCLLRHELDCSGTPNLEFRLSSQVSRRSYGNRRDWVCREKFRVDPRTRLRVRRVPYVDVSWWTGNDRMVARERR